MKKDLKHGLEPQNFHFSRISLPLQGWMIHSGGFKHIGHFFGSHAAKSNWHFTLSTFNQFLDLLIEKGTIECSELEEMILVADGCESQNWSINVFGNLVRIVAEQQNSGRFENLKALVFVKTASGHGKSSLDGDFHCSKGLLDRAANLYGGIGPNEDNPTTGFSGARAAVQFLKQQELFSPQYERTAQMLPDKDKFILNRRFVEQATLDGRYNEHFVSG